MAWDYIAKKVDDALDLFSTTLQEDEEELVDIRTDKSLTSIGKVNVQKCILHRMNLKRVLTFFKDCSEKVKKLVKMTKGDALSEINSWREMDNNNLTYFKDTVLALLPADNEVGEKQITTGKGNA